MMKIRPSESELIGEWILLNGRLQGDTNCHRIDWLIANQLQKVAVSKQSGGWEALFRDPTDGRYWERTYPHSEMQGGGPPRLAVLSSEQAQAKYEINL